MTAPFDGLRLEAPRLLLRPPRLEDLDAWAEMMQDPEAARFIGGTMPRPLSWRGVMTMIGCNVGPGKLPAPFESDVVDIWGQTRAEWGAR